MKRLKYVINYDFPGSIEQYAHRIGRVGRQGVAGESYSLITRNMAPLVPSLVKLLKKYGQEVEPNLQALSDDTEVLADGDGDGQQSAADDDDGDDKEEGEDDAAAVDEEEEEEDEGGDDAADPASVMAEDDDQE